MSQSLAWIDSGLKKTAQLLAPSSLVAISKWMVSVFSFDCALCLRENSNYNQNLLIQRGEGKSSKGRRHFQGICWTTRKRRLRYSRTKLLHPTKCAKHLNPLYTLLGSCNYWAINKTVHHTAPIGYNESFSPLGAFATTLCNLFLERVACSYNLIPGIFFVRNWALGFLNYFSLGSISGFIFR